MLEDNSDENQKQGLYCLGAPYRGDAVSTIGPERAANLTAELHRKLSLDQALHYDLVIENDLTGRAVLAVLWAHRSLLTVHIATDEPTASAVQALKAALETVRNAPAVQLITPHRAHQLVAGSKPLIWAIDGERTDQDLRTTLQDRDPASTVMPLCAGFEALEGNRPDQRHPLHELVLRDVIHQHARFLNFFGDRFNPLDLYERSKYPQWLTPPKDFDAALPQFWCRLVGPDDSVLNRREFLGTLEFQPDEIRRGNRLEVDFTALGKMFTTVSDLTISCATSSCDHAGLQLHVHRNNKLVHASDIAPGQPVLNVPLRGLRARDSVRAAVVVTQEPLNHPATCVIDLQVGISPPDTDAKPSELARLRTWVAALAFRRQ